MDRRFFLRALSAASFWSFLFDGEPDYWPATIIGSYTQVAAPPVVGTQLTACVGWLESSVASMRAEGNYAVAADGQLKPVSDRWVTY